MCLLSYSLLLSRHKPRTYTIQSHTCTGGTVSHGGAMLMGVGFGNCRGE